MHLPLRMTLPGFVGIALLTAPALAQSSSRAVPSIQQPSYPSAYPAQGNVIVQPNVTYPSQPNTVAQPGFGTRTTYPMQQQPGSGTRTTYPTQQPVVTQPGSTMGSDSRNMVMPATVGTFEQKLWNYLIRAKYRNWAPVPGKSDAMYEGQSPHGAFLKMYLNRKAAGSPSELPHGSMVIKENYGPDQKSLMAVTAMYKTKGYNPKAGDWYWVKFNPDGTVANKSTDNGLKRLAGRVDGCISCHDGAAGGDFAFFND